MEQLKSHRSVSFVSFWGNKKRPTPKNGSFVERRLTPNMACEVACLLEYYPFSLYRGQVKLFCKRLIAYSIYKPPLHYLSVSL